MRRAAGHKTVGVKVGYANKAMWRVLKLDTLVWAHMYDDTVQSRAGERGHAVGRAHDLAEDRAGDRLQDEGAARRRRHRASRCARSGRMARARVRDHRLPVRRLEVSARGLRRRLRSARRAHRRRAASRSLPPTSPSSSSSCRRSRSASRRTAQLVAEGSGKNSLRSPALCLAELASAMAKQDGAGAARRGRPGQLRHADRVHADPVGRNVDRIAVDGISLPPLDTDRRLTRPRSTMTKGCESP